MKDFSISKWIWVGYPVLALIFMYASFTILMGIGQERIVGFAAKRDQVEGEEVKVAKMENKLMQLKQADKDVLGSDLSQLAVAIPLSKKVSLLVGEMRNAASQAGTTLDEYKGLVGQVKEGAVVPNLTDDGVGLVLSATFNVSDFKQVQEILKGLYNQLPLVKVNKISYALGKLTVEAEGAWSPWKTSTNDVISPLPDYQTQRDTAKTAITNFQVFSEMIIPTGSTGTTNPF
jgi:hypothetical protein